MLQLMVACGCYELMCDALVKNAGEKLEILGLRQRHLRTEKAQVGKVLGLEETWRYEDTDSPTQAVYSKEPLSLL